MEELRVSVRELVEFTLHGADIRLISGRMQDMLDGTLGHQARQKRLGAGVVGVRSRVPTDGGAVPSAAGVPAQQKRRAA